MTLTREQIEEGRALIVDLISYPHQPTGSVWAWLSDNFAPLCDLALRALPLPEGEVKELVKRLEHRAKFIRHAQTCENCEDIDFSTDEVALFYDDYLKAIDILSRQAASLAKLEKEHTKLNAACSDRIGELLMRAEAAEASLASARRALERITKLDRGSVMAIGGAWEIATDWLASPRQEGGTL